MGNRKKKSSLKSKTKDQKGFRESLVKQFQKHLTKLLVFVLLLGLFVLSFRFDSFEKEQQVSFQEFRNELLKPRLVDHVVVSSKGLVEIYARKFYPNQTEIDVLQGKQSGGKYVGFFYIANVDSFEKKLERAQELLGFDPNDFVPVIYSSGNFLFSEIIGLVSSILPLLFLVYMSGIYKIFGPQFVKVDKNAKNKVGNGLYFLCFFISMFLVDYCLFHY